MKLKYPFQLGLDGRIADTDDDDYLDSLIEQVLFTTPGERINRPKFGCNLMSLVYEPADPQLIATSSLMVQSALREWLNGVIELQDVRVNLEDTLLRIRIVYKKPYGLESRLVEFTKSVSY